MAALKDLKAGDLLYAIDSNRPYKVSIVEVASVIIRLQAAIVKVRPHGDLSCCGRRYCAGYYNGEVATDDYYIYYTEEYTPQKIVKAFNAAERLRCVESARDTLIKFFSK